MVLVLALVLLSSFRVRTSSGGTKVSLCHQRRALLYTQNAEKFDFYPTNQHSLTVSEQKHVTVVKEKRNFPLWFQLGSNFSLSEPI